LILNADDLGYSPAVNRAIFALHACGRLDSASLVVNLPHSRAAMEGACERPELAVGIHLNLTKGRPCLPPEQIPSLAGGDGVFHTPPAFFARALAGRVSLGEVEAELRVQIERALAAGIRISHLDSHSHWHVLPDFNRLLQNLLTEYSISRIRTTSLRRVLLPNPLWLAAVTRRPVPRGRPAQLDYLLSLHQWLRGAGEVSPLLHGRQVCRLLARPGMTAELVLHPGRAGDPDFLPDTLPAERRQWEFDFAQGDVFAEWLAAVTGWVAHRPAG